MINYDKTNKIIILNYIENNIKKINTIYHINIKSISIKYLHDV